MFWTNSGHKYMILDINKPLLKYYLKIKYIVILYNGQRTKTIYNFDVRQNI